MSRWFRCTGALAGALLLSACGGGSGSGGIDGPCEPPKGTQIALFYPAPGATGIPDDFGQVIFASSAALPPGYEAHVVGTGGRSAVLFGPVGPAPDPLPQPNAAPSFPKPVYQASLNPGTTFASGSTISVYLNEMLPSGYCLATVNLGSFNVR